MADYQAGEHLRFQLFDQDLPFVKEDDYLGSVVLESHRFCPQARLECLRPNCSIGCRICRASRASYALQGVVKVTWQRRFPSTNRLGVEAYLEVKVTVKLLPDSEEQEAQRPKTSDSMGSVSSNDSGGWVAGRHKPLDGISASTSGGE